VAEIVLCTLNARYQHTAFGLRCLRANLGTLRDRSVLLEFESTARPADVAERILGERPTVVGLGVYVWNVTVMMELVELLARLAPEVAIVLGGPEVSHELDAQPWTQHATAIVAGEGEWHFRAICEAVLAGQPLARRVFPSQTGPLDTLVLPYAEYTDEDLANRVLYVEASRGCPYSCEFCLSALDERVRAFPVEPFLAALGSLIDRGARHFKFVDRTFNLDLKATARLLTFFLERWHPGFFLHFEMVPDRFPAALRELVGRFPPGSLQFEVGIQTFDPNVAQLISRRMDLDKTEDNLRFLASANVHVHADLIAGLPAETVESFARGFDRLVGLGPDEIQLGILKRLRGAPIARHTEAFGMLYASRSPYEVLRTSTMSFQQLQHLKRFASMWDSVANSGNFSKTLPLLLASRTSPFEAFSRFVEWLVERTGRTSHLSLLRLSQALLEFLVAQGVDDSTARAALLDDYRGGGRHETPGFLKAGSRRPRAAVFDARQRRRTSSE
jgi:hypothetical protein